MNKKHKVIMHFNKPGSKVGTPWTVHYRGKCHIVTGIKYHSTMVSEFKHWLKQNPRAFFTTYASSIEINEDNFVEIK